MKPTMRTFSMSTLKLLSGNFFMAECIRLSKPCHLKEIAIGSQAFNKWGSGENPLETFRNKFGLDLKELINKRNQTNQTN